MPYFEKENLVQYIVKKHNQIKKYEISPVKLQKTLYLLYAMWAGNATIMNKDIEKNNEGVFEIGGQFEVDLFEPAFEAWMYGPVDREIYHRFKNKRYQECSTQEIMLNFDNAVDLESMLTSFIDTIISQSFEINDFALVDLTHEDVSWKRVFDKDKSGKSPMIKRDIIDEYTERLKN